VAHDYNVSTWEAEAGGLRVQGQSGLHNDTLSQTRERERERSQTQKDK
jgi:hypothetical protein